VNTFLKNKFLLLFHSKPISQVIISLFKLIQDLKRKL